MPGRVRASHIAKGHVRARHGETGADLPSLEALMIRYRDRPMDFADATLVHLAERESLSDVLTVDHDDRDVPDRRAAPLPHRA